MIELFTHWSDIAYYFAIVLYAAAFVFFALDLANRGSAQAKRAAAERTVGSAVGATQRAAATSATASRAAAGSAASAGAVADEDAHGGTATLLLDRKHDPEGDVRTADDIGILSSTAAHSDTPAVTPGPRSSWRDLRATRFLPIAMVLTLVGFAGHVTSAVTLGLAAGRVPWANLYEFTLTATGLVVFVFLVSQRWQDLRFLGTFVTGMVTLFLGISSVSFRTPVMPLQPALQSWWLVVHVFIASLATGLLTLGFGLSVLQLGQTRREARIRAGRPVRRGPLAGMPSSTRLEDLSFRITVVGFILWTFTIVAGAVWAEAAWGRYWGWDTKEIWSFIIWVVYAGYLHARTTRGWRGTPSAWLSIVGFATVIFNFAIVNVFFKGLHAYSGL